jgi:hypothetical protein
MEQIIFYNSLDTTGVSQATAHAALLTRPNGVLEDVAGLNVAGINAVVQGYAVDPSDIDEVLICMEIASFGIDNLAELDTIIAGTTVLEGTAQANADDEVIVLDGDASAENAAYANMFIKVGSIYRYITGYTGATKSAAVQDTGDAIADGAYTIYTLPTSVKYMASSNFSSAGFWDELYPDVEAPYIMQLLKASRYFNGIIDTATYDASTITEAFTEGIWDASTSDFHDWYVGIHTATTGAGQVKKIESNTAAVITLAEAFDPLPTGTIEGYIGRDTDLMHDKYFGYAVAAYKPGIGEWRKMLDMYDELSSGDVGHVYTDDATVQKYVELGKPILKAIWSGVVS